MFGLLRQSVARLAGSPQVEGCVAPELRLRFDQLEQLVKAAATMREVQASEAKIHLPQLLHEVEAGETLIITRHGRAIARIVPQAARRQEEIDRAIERIKRLRARTGRITTDELLSSRH